MEVSIEYMALKREADRVALRQQEDGARTQVDFENLASMYDKIEKKRIRRERRRELEKVENIVDISYSNVPVIPKPLDHEWWRELMNGNFLDVIFDCPYEIHELISSRNLYELVKKLNEGQKEVLYYRVIRRWSIQRIAKHRGQTDRNVLKVYITMIESLRYKLYMRLLPRFKAEASLTSMQREFVADNIKKYGDGKPKRQCKKKTAVDSGNDI
ncbi:MAG: hypothetical protein FWD71_20830 [Oscillospiraceae bacterium]|nr:hypothetical protein [Oscillospiraceae bacterium]